MLDLTKEPIVGQWYETEYQTKLKFITKTSKYYLYEDLDGNLWPHLEPYVSQTGTKIIKKATMEKVLPEVSVKLYVIIQNEDQSNCKRGRIYFIDDTQVYMSKEQALKVLNKYFTQNNKMSVEIMELTGVLPEKTIQIPFERK